MAVLDLRSAHAQYAWQDVEEDLAGPVRHGVRGERAIIDVVCAHGDGDGRDDEDHGEHEVLAEERHHQRRGRYDLGQHEEEDGER